MQIETQRLILRKMNADDYSSLYAILSDPETMRFYPAPFDEEKVKNWITRNQQHYATDGLGLWTVVLKETGEVIGDCGITMQPIHGQMLPEIGYHIHKNHRRKGYAAEAARRCMEFVFTKTDFPAVYSYMKHDNIPSYGVAMKNGMQFIEEYDDPVNTRTRVYGITREEWKRLQHTVCCGMQADIHSWMELVNRVRGEFPGLERESDLLEHRKTVLRFMDEGRALCVKDHGAVVGVLLLSKKHNMICCLAVEPEYRRRGIASALMKKAVSILDSDRDILVTTFRAEDPKGVAPRALYARYGFEADELCMELGYPTQRFVRRAGREARA